MSERRKGDLKMDVQWEGKYIIERTEEGKLILLACKGDPGLSADVRNETVLAEEAEKWLETVRPQVKESTYMKYWNLLHSYIIPELGGIKWDAINRELIEKFCGKMLSVGGKKGDGLSAKTVTDIMSVLRQIFRYASIHGARVSFDISSLVIKKESKSMKILTRKEQNRLYRYLCRECSARNLGLLICMFTGLRLGEICALRWEDISFSEQTIFVRRTMQRIQTKDDPGKKTKIIVTPPKSDSSVRRIPIPRELARILYLHRGRQKGYVLTGTPECFVEPRTMERYFKKVLDLAGIAHVNFHVLRHTFATRCVEIDFDVKSLSEILGHASVTITLNRYVHPSMELKRSNMQKLALSLAAE